MIRFRSGLAALLSVASLASYSLPAQAQARLGQDSPVPSDTLLRGFQDPPNGARPRVWWHWMNGNIAPEGIKLDLEWMHSVGLGGVTIFEGAISTPQVVPHRLVYMTPEWKQAFNYAVTTARGLGLEVAIASSPGCSPARTARWSATTVCAG